MKNNIASLKNNIYRHPTSINEIDRQVQAGHKSAVVWFTGLSGSGKSTLAHEVEIRLFEKSCRTFVFDGDNVRHGLCSDLSFSNVDRRENIRRIGEMSKLFTEAGVIALTAFISPFRSDRDFVRRLVGEDKFIEIYCSANLTICEQRDVKGLYAKARLGLIKDFTGISSPYEAPLEPELVLDTGAESLKLCVNKVIDLLTIRNIIKY